jgi:hypothetical protein
MGISEGGVPAPRQIALHPRTLFSAQNPTFPNDLDRYRGELPKKLPQPRTTVGAPQTSLTSLAGISKQGSSKRKSSFRRRAFQYPFPRKRMLDGLPSAGSPIQCRSLRLAEFRAPSRASHLAALPKFLRRVRGVCPGGLFSDWKDRLADTSTLVACLRLVVY